MMEQMPLFFYYGGDNVDDDGDDEIDTSDTDEQHEEQRGEAITATTNRRMRASPPSTSTNNPGRSRHNNNSSRHRRTAAAAVAALMTARFLSLVVVLLSIAPLGSIYLVFSSSSSSLCHNSNTNTNNHQSELYNGDDGLSSGGGGGDLFVASSSSPDTAAARPAAPRMLGEVINDPNATLEEIWTALFIGGGTSDPIMLAYFPGIMAFNNNNNNMINWELRRQLSSFHGIKIILPWLLSFFLGVVVPTCLSISSFFRHRRQHYERTKKRERRFAKTVKLLKSYTKVLTPNDRIYSAAKSPTGDTDVDSVRFGFNCSRRHRGKVDKENEKEYDDQQDAAPSSWVLPNPGVPINNNIENNSNDDDDDDDGNNRRRSSISSSSRTVVEGCAICLNHYKVDESVIWSPNPSCVHAFHDRCIMSWLFSRKSNKDQLCPCCRQCFVGSS